MTTEEAAKSSKGDASGRGSKAKRRLRAFMVDVVITLVGVAAAAFGAGELHIIEIRQTYNNQTFNEVQADRSDLETEVDQLSTEVERLEADNTRLRDGNQGISDTTDAAPGQVIYLDSLEFITGALKKATFAFGTDTFPRSLTRSLSYCNDSRTVEWLLPATPGTFDVEIGVDPASPRRDAEVSFQIFVDDSPIEETTLGVGDRKIVSAAVQGGERLRFEVSLREGTDTPCGSGATAVWGSPRITAG